MPWRRPPPRNPRNDGNHRDDLEVEDDEIPQGRTAHVSARRPPPLATASPAAPTAGHLLAEQAELTGALDRLAAGGHAELLVQRCRVFLGRVL